MSKSNAKLGYGITDFPSEVFKIISDFLEKDIDFINLTMTCKIFYEYANMRDLSSIYPISRIYEALDRYIFTRILYDSKQYNSELKIPPKIRMIKLADKFTDDLSLFYSNVNLERIDLGLFFTNIDSLSTIPDSINKRDITTKIISNVICKELCSTEIKILDESFGEKSNDQHEFPRYYHFMPNHIIKKKAYGNLLKSLNKDDSMTYEEIKDLQRRLLINKNPIHGKQQLVIVRDILAKTDSDNKLGGYTPQSTQRNTYSKYVKLFEKFDVSSATDRYLLAELVQLYIEILDKNMEFIKTIFNMIAQKYGLKDVYQYSLYVLRQWDIKSGFSEIYSIDELHKFTSGSMISHIDADGIYNPKGYLIDIGGNYFTYVTSIWRREPFKSHKRFLKYIKEHTHKVDIKNVKNMLVGDIKKNKRLYVIPDSNPGKCSYPLVINGKVVHDFKNKCEYKNYIGSRYYTESIAWTTLFGEYKAPSIETRQ